MAVRGAAVAALILVGLLAQGVAPAGAQQAATAGPILVRVTNSHGTSDTTDDTPVSGLPISAVQDPNTAPDGERLTCTTGDNGSCSVQPTNTGVYVVDFTRPSLPSELQDFQIEATSGSHHGDQTVVVDVVESDPVVVDFVLSPQPTSSSVLPYVVGAGLAALVLALVVLLIRRARGSRPSRSPDVGAGAPPVPPPPVLAPVLVPASPVSSPVAEAVPAAPAPPMRPRPEGYVLGVDLGTTFTAAAVLRAGTQHPEMVTLGTRAAAIPSLILVREDGSILVGEEAEQRATTNPDRIARAFKRRMGDPTPIFLGGSPWSAEALTGTLLREVLDRTARFEGAWPTCVVVTHPANWGSYKLDVLTQATRLSDISLRFEFLSEPEAAAIYYASQERVEPDTVICVYDLGGGTFDATLVTKTADGWRQLGRPEGIERLGGMDFDAAIFEHVRTQDASIDALDPDDPTAMAAVAQIRDACTSAKEALSSDTDATLTLAMPTGLRQVRLTRSEFEALITPQLEQSVAAARRAVSNAHLTTRDVRCILLVGGSSRIPLVGQVLSQALGIPIVADAHPKHAVASGAAMYAARTATAANP